MSKHPTPTKPPKPPERRALGRGLAALMGDAAASAESRLEQEFQRVPLDRLIAQKGQPRKRFEETALEELTQSLREHGILEPIIVRKVGDDLEIIAGERRWRAARRAGLSEVPVVIKDVSPADAFELALVENVQRADLDPLETAEAYQRLIDEHDYTQESLAVKLGKSRSGVANTLRLMQLPSSIKTHVASGSLSEGHARTLLSMSDEAAMIALADEAVEKKYTVRDVEVRARKTAKKPEAEKPAPAEKPVKSPNVRELEARLAGALGMAVVVREDGSKTSGTVELAYDSLAQLDMFIEKILGP